MSNIKRRDADFVTRTLQVKVKPNSRVSTLEESGDGTWLARIEGD